MEKQTMKEIPVNDRPYERCIKQGPEALSEEELLSVIIRTGSRKANSLETARQILRLNYPQDGILGLCHLTLPELKEVEGIGDVKGIQLLCIGELSRRISRRFVMSEITRFQNPEEVVNYYMEEMRHMEQEQLHVMLTDNKQGMIRDVLISKGTVNTSIVSPREILIEALRYRAVGMIMVHNHPSGDPTPSREDCSITQRVKEAGKLVGIQLLDHIVIGDGSYSSFKKEGML